MFLFESVPWYSWLMFIGVVVGLIVLSEIGRQNRATAVALFIVLPVVLTIFVWPRTATGSTGTWFHWVKVYSALAGCIGFALIRLVPRVENSRFKYYFPPLILAINIAEACIRGFQVYSVVEGIHDGVYMIGGPWNIMNGIAGILSILTITGFMGIYVSRDKKAMMWPDMLWFYIIAYDIWNFAYVYNCVSDHAFYAGLALLVAPTIVAFFIKKGAWLQHRAHTLAFWMMFTMSVPGFVDESMFAVQSSHNTTALFVVSLLALLANAGVFVFCIYKVVSKKRNPLKQELFTELKAYEKVAAQ